MKPTAPLLYRTAELVSVVGHPLVTLSLFTLYVAFRELPRSNALVVVGLVFGGVVIPVSWHNYRRTRRGRYTNFDVSDRRERTRFYPVLLGLVALVTGLLFATGQPLPFGYGAVCLLMLLVVSYAINPFIKLSLHTSLSFFLAWALAVNSQPVGLAMGMLAVLIAFSRLVLKRHTLPEVLAGALTGLIGGTGLYLMLSGIG